MITEWVTLKLPKGYAETLDAEIKRSKGMFSSRADLIKELIRRNIQEVRKNEIRGNGLAECETTSNTTVARVYPTTRDGTASTRKSPERTGRDLENFEP